MARKKKKDDEIRTDGWMDTFADTMTLLLTFFILLYSISAVDSEKLKKLSEALQYSLTGDSSIEDVTGMFLDDAINWFKENDIPLYGIQENPTQKNWTTSPKCYAELYIDDAALGCPIMWDMDISERPFVNWELVLEMIGE